MKILLIFCILFVFSLGTGYFAYGFVKNLYLAKKIKQEETISQIIKEPFQTSTGVDINATSSDRLINNKWDLISKMPISEKLFRIEFDFKRNKFIVKLDINGGDGSSAFENWLQENGYEKLPAEDFIFMR